MAAKAGQFAVDAGVTPSWVLPCQPQHQPADLLAGRRPARPSWIGPFTREKMAVPGQPGSRRDEPTGTQQTGPQPGYRCQDRAVGPVRLRPGNLAPEHHHFVTEHDDLRVLGRLATAQQYQPHEDLGHDQVQQTDRHKPRSCRNSLNLPNHSSRALRRDLERYTPRGEGLCQDMYQMPRGRLADLDQAGQPEQRDQCREQRQEPVVGQAPSVHRSSLSSLTLRLSKSRQPSCPVPAGYPGPRGPCGAAALPAGCLLAGFGWTWSGHLLCLLAVYPGQTPVSLCMPWAAPRSTAVLTRP